MVPTIIHQATDPGTPPAKNFWGSKFLSFFPFWSKIFKPIFLEIGEILTSQFLTRDRTFLALSNDVRYAGVVRIKLGFLGPQSAPVWAIFRILTLWRPLASLVVTVALRRYCRTIGHTQMVSVCFRKFFATTYGLGLEPKKCLFWPVFRENKLSPVARPLYSVRTLPAYKSSLHGPMIVRFSNNVRNDVRFLSRPPPTRPNP